MSTTPDSSRSSSPVQQAQPPSIFTSHHRRTHSRSDPTTVPASWNSPFPDRRPPVFDTRPTNPPSRNDPRRPLPASRLSDSGQYFGPDRKRRFTGSTETGRRRPITGGQVRGNSHEFSYRPPPASGYPPAPSFGPSAGDGPIEVIDLTMSSSPPTRNQASPQRPSPPSSRRSGSYVVPPWQPDSDVAECPICRRQFGLLFRRHHCRKCGRVVCNDCSPHRITIPRQYIVHPPGTDPNSSSSRLGFDVVDLTRDSDSSPPLSAVQRRHYGNAALGGGEKVRLCNPCVPDPQPEQPSIFDLSVPPRLPPVFDTRFPLTASSVPTYPGYDRRPVQEPRQRQYPPHPGTRLRIDADDEEDNISSSPDVFVGASRYYAMNTAAQTRSPPAMLPAHSRFHSMDVSRMNPLPQPPFVSNRPRVRSLLEPNHPRLMSPIPPPPGMAPVPAQNLLPPRPRIREEDICPVCRGQLPPKGPNGDETERETHIIECITQHDTSASTPLSRHRTDPQNLSRSLPAAESAPDLSTSLASSSLSPPPPRIPTQMLRFTATEKDCMAQADEHGQPQQQECSICMVEYEVGDRLARLECWCKFHDECIVEWFARKRECPVHKIV